MAQWILEKRHERHWVNIKHREKEFPLHCSCQNFWFFNYYRSYVLKKPRKWVNGWFALHFRRWYFVNCQLFDFEPFAIVIYFSSPSYTPFNDCNPFVFAWLLLLWYELRVRRFFWCSFDVELPNYCYFWDSLKLSNFEVNYLE